MINPINGRIVINKILTLYPGFTFDNFKKTPYYTNQDGVRVIDLDEIQEINGRKYYVSFFFVKQELYAVTLICTDICLTEEHESKRQELHNKIIQESGLENNKQYSWGKINSSYDPRSNSSEIVILYSPE